MQHTVIHKDRQTAAAAHKIIACQHLFLREEKVSLHRYLQACGSPAAADHMDLKLRHTHRIIDLQLLLGKSIFYGLFFVDGDQELIYIVFVALVRRQPQIQGMVLPVIAHQDILKIGGIE